MCLKRTSPAYAKHSVGAGILAISFLTFACATWVVQAAELNLPAEASAQDATTAHSIRISADKMATSNGGTRLSGNVTVQAAGPARKGMKFTATQMTADGPMTVLQGNVRLSLGKHVFTTDRAVINQETSLVTIKMDAAELTQLQPGQ